MSMSTEDKIRHYQRSIDRSLEKKPRLLHCIEMLAKLPVTVNHLQITGVGRTVNALRKIDEGVGDKAKQLVNKWKHMVANHVDSSEDEDEACVPDVPDCYESPDCDSDPENEVNQRENNFNQNRPEAFSSVISDSPPLVVDTDTDNVTELPPSTSNNHREDNSDDESEILPNQSSSSHQLNSSLEHLSNKSKHSKKDSEFSSHKDKSSNSHSSHSKNAYNLEVSDHKKKNKNKSESHKDKKHSDDRKRKYESSSSDRESDKKKKRVSVSEEEEQQQEEDNTEENVSMQDEKSEEEVLEGEEEDCKDSVKEKANDKHHSSSSKNSKSKSHESRDKSRKDKKSSKSDGRGKEENSKSEEHCSKDSFKSKSSHSSSSSKDHSKDRDKDKHSKDKNKESSSKSHKDEKDRSSKKEIKDDRGKSKEQDKKDKERKDSKHHKEHKEHKDDREPKEQKEKKKPKITDGIDCNSGTSFADALGMCTIPPPKKKKESSSSSSKSNKDSLSLNLSSSSTSSSSSNINKSSSSKSSVLVKNNSSDPSEPLSLLSSNIQLEPLNRLDEEVDLAATLPEPSPYYKPLPHVSHALRRQEEDEMLSQVIYAKNQRTKVFSGKKDSQNKKPPVISSLYDMCIRVLIENIDALEYTGGVPYFIIKPVLERASATQLYTLEHHNPYLIEDTDSLWEFHCNKDFRSKKREEMESWREMYERCIDERNAKLKALTANIKQSIDNSQPLRQTKLAYIDNIVKPPRNVQRKQAKYGTAHSNTSASDLKKKLITGAVGNSGTSSNSNPTSNSSNEKIYVPPPPAGRSRQPSSLTVKKTKAPLMAKALQAIKGRYKR